jgi:hypothetical protein
MFFVLDIQFMIKLEALIDVSDIQMGFENLMFRIPLGKLPIIPNNIGGTKWRAM